jgi:eukaryotic-like serine/threonine-protein kinase
VPRIEGMKLPAAERALRRAHCRVGKIKHEHSNKVGRGRVVATSPGRGRRKMAGGRIELLVSSGP